MKPLIQTAFIVCLLQGVIVVTNACSCADPSIRNKFRAYDLIFVGQVIDVKGAPRNSDIFVYSVTLKVEQLWKGSEKPEINVLWAWDKPGWCNDLPLKNGERYLIYTRRDEGHYAVYPDCGANYFAKYHSEEIGKLNRFWFRIFARIWPFPKI